MSTGRLPSTDGGIQPTVVDAKGDLIVATAADTVSRLAVGSNDQVLTADSTTATGLKWATASAGGMTLLTSGTLSGASVALTSISGSYKDLRLIIKNFKPATDSASMNMRINNDSNSRYANPVTGGTGTFGATEWDPIAANDDTVAYGFTIIDIYDYANTTTWKTAFTRAWGTDPTTTTSYNLRLRYSIYNQTTAITELNLFPNTGNFTSGNYYLYGVN